MVPLVSVIVPIYNVEPYLRKCLDSLKNQTMKEIEVICIDDGSTDSSGVIADEYIAEHEVWPKFTVIHTEHKGLSAARNKGIEESCSEYLMFVDSDDWVDNEFCRIPYETAVEYNADMVIFQYYDTKESGRIRRKKQVKAPMGRIDHEGAIDFCGTASWRRLVKKVLFDDVLYPEGHVFEDFFIMHRLVYKTTCIVNLSDRLYYYRFRKGSICHSITGENDRFMLSKHRYHELITFGYPERKARRQLLGAALRCCGRIQNCDSDEYCEAKRIVRSTKIPEQLSMKEKVMIVLFKSNEIIYRMMYKAYLNSTK